MADGHQRHQLELHTAAPALLALLQSLPTGDGARPTAIDVAADGAQAIAPGLIKGPLRPRLHLLNAALLPLLQVHAEGIGHLTAAVGVLPPGEGLIEVGVGLHQGGERQGQPHSCLQRVNGRNPARLQLQLHRHQAIGIAAGQIVLAGIQQRSGQLQAQAGGAGAIRLHQRWPGASPADPPPPR